MPTVNNHGVNIYYEVEGQGPPIAFGHGAMGNISMWPGYGYVEMLKDKYKLNHAQTSAAVDLLVPRALEFLATGK